MSVSSPVDEVARLAALRKYEILDTLKEEEFDDLARLAAAICDVPIALVNLIDSDRLWSKAQVGLPLEEMPRADAFCATTIQTQDLMVVPDLRADGRFAANPTVVEDPHLRFYAGAPLVTADGYGVGTICVLDRVPRDLSEQQKEALRALARQVMSQLELRRTLRLLEQAEGVARLRMHALEAATTAVVISDVQQEDNPLIYVNPAFEKLTGYAPTEMLGRNCRFLQGAETDKATVARLREAVEDERDLTVEILNYRKDGQPFWQELAISPVRDGAGRVTHFTGIQTDITERHAAEEALRRSEAYFHALLDNALDMVLLLDENTRILYASPSVERVTGRGGAAESGRGFMENIHPDDKGTIDEAFKRIVEHPHELIATEFRVRRSDGTWAFIEAITRNKLGDASVGGVVVNARDITARKEAEEALRAQYAFTKAITTSLGEGVYAVDRQGKVTFVNPAAATLVGWTEAELQGRAMHDTVHYQREDGTRAAAADCPLLTPTRTGQTYHTDHDVFTRKDGTLFPVACTAAPILDGGEISGVVVTFTDITERLSFQQQLQNQNAILEERVRERTEALEQAGLEILRRLGLAAEFRDDETGQHVQRVGEMAARIARQLGQSEEEVALLRLAAPLHDAGKIGIPDRVLLKPGALSAEEFAQMKTHTLIGGGILAGSTFAVLMLAEEIALTHHEHWDGQGYPLNLREEGIALAGRITAVADVFDALTHARPYKEAWTVEDAVALIRRESGRHFDPRVVEAFEALLEHEPRIVATADARMG